MVWISLRKTPLSSFSFFVFSSFDLIESHYDIFFTISISVVYTIVSMKCSCALEWIDTESGNIIHKNIYNNRNNNNNNDDDSL